MSVSPKLTVTILDQEVELLMSYGLLSRLAASIQDVDALTNSGFSATSRDFLLETVLTKKGKSGAFDKVDLDEITEMEEVEKVLDWVNEHLLDFFIKQLTKSQQSLLKFKNVAEEIGASFEPSTDGSTT